MNIWKGAASWLLFLIVPLLGAILGAYIGGGIGDAMDKRNGTFGKGLEGSPNGIGLLLLGAVLGAIIAALTLRAWYRWRKTN